MTYLRDDSSADAGELRSRRRHSSDDAGAEQYTYQRPADWKPSARRRHALPEDSAAATPVEATPVDWWSTPPTREQGGYANLDRFAAPAPRQDDPAAEAYDGFGGANYDRPNYGGPNYGEPSFGSVNYESPKDLGSAWDEDALRAAAGVPYREARPQGPIDHGTVDYSKFGADETTPVPPVYGVPGQRRAFEAVSAPGDVEVPAAPPTEAKRSLPRKHLILRIAAVMVLVFSAAIGVAVTVLDDTDPDTVQVQEEIQADAPADAASSDSDTSAADDAAQQAAVDAQAKDQQETAVDTAKSRAASKAAAAQKAAAQQAERAEDQRASRSEARTAAAADDDSSSSSGGSSGDPVPTAPVDCDTYSGNKKTGCALLSEFGFATSQMSCIDKLWMKESGWREGAENPSSGAYGIPQALPGSKMASVASDWKTNPATQIRWGLGYIKGRYGTPCAAWAHSQANNWY